MGLHPRLIERPDQIGDCVVWRIDRTAPPPLPPALPEELCAFADANRPDRLFRRRVLRALCAAQLKRHPDAICLQTTQAGAPRLADEDAWVSLAARDTCIVAAFSPRPIGVDVEALETQDTPELSALAPPCPGLGFATRWAILEAAAKQDGRGLARDLSAFDIERLEGGRFSVSTGDARLQVFVFLEARFVIAVAM